MVNLLSLAKGSFEVVTKLNCQREMSTNNILQDNEIENSLIIKSKYVVMGTSDGQISIVNLTNGQYCGS